MMLMKIRKTSSRCKLIISCVLSLIFLGGICYSGYQIVEWLIANHKTEEITEKIAATSEISEIQDYDDAIVVDQSEDDKKNSYYWKYLSMNLLDVNFDELKKTNSDTAGWISLSGTNINYPFVKTTNNDFYLNHSFDKTYNQAGWVFADFRNKLDSSDRNLILYAHGRVDGSMFGSLRAILTSGWLKDANNFSVRTATATESVVWQVFSVYRIPVTSDYIQTSFSSDDEFGAFANKLRARSVQDFNTSVNGKDRILTLSTCYNNDRIVLHAKLIKRLPR